MMKVLVYLIFSAAVVYASRKDYNGWKTFYVRPMKQKQIQDIHSMFEYMMVDFLVMPTIKSEGIALVGPEYLKSFTEALDDLNISYRIHCDNINAALNFDDYKIAEMGTKNFAGLGRNVPYENFHNLTVSPSGFGRDVVGRCNRLRWKPSHNWNQTSQIYKYLIYLSQNYGDRVTLVQAGKSFELQPIYYLKISTNNFHGSKPVIVIDGGTHAREWITPTVVTYAMYKLIENVTEPDLLDHFDWILFPVVNPDGYNYTFAHCPGVDIDRNFKYEWAAEPSNPCLETYPGRKPLSEVESRVLMNILRLHKKDIAMYINMHSYGSYILYPFGYDGSMPKNADTLQSFGDAMADAINSVTKFEKYSVGNVVEKLQYKTSGSVTDYAHSIGIPLTFSFELPGFPKMNDGFVVDPSLIKPIVEETWEAIVTGARLIKPKPEPVIKVINFTACNN